MSIYVCTCYRIFVYEHRQLSASSHNVEWVSEENEAETSIMHQRSDIWRYQHLEKPINYRVDQLSKS